MKHVIYQRSAFTLLAFVVIAISSCSSLPDKPNEASINTLHHAYVWDSPIPITSAPIAVHRQYLIGFVGSPYTHWEIIYEDNSRTEVLSGDGESLLAKLQFEKMYSKWFNEQEELWGGHMPSEGTNYAPKEIRNTYYRNLNAQQELLLQNNSTQPKKTTDVK